MVKVDTTTKVYRLTLAPSSATPGGTPGSGSGDQVPERVGTKQRVSYYENMKLLVKDPCEGKSDDGKVDYSINPEKLRQHSTLGVNADCILTVNGGTIVLARGSVADFSGDAIVNSTDETLLGGSGINDVITERGGDQLRKYRLQEPAVMKGGGAVRCPTGEARMTPGGDLLADFCIHAVVPRFGRDQPRRKVHAKRVLLYKAYKSAMKLASDHHEIWKIGFPVLGADPKERGDQPLRKILECGIAAIVEDIKPELTVYLIAFTTAERRTLMEEANRLVRGDKFSISEKAPSTLDGCLPCMANDTKSQKLVLLMTLALIILTFAAFLIVAFTSTKGPRDT